MKKYVKNKYIIYNIVNILVCLAVSLVIIGGNSKIEFFTFGTVRLFNLENFTPTSEIIL